MGRHNEGVGAVWPALPFAAIFPALMGLIEVYRSQLPRPDPRMSASVLFVAGVAVILLVHSAMVHRVAPRAGVAAALGALVWALSIAFGDVDALGRKISDVAGAAPEPDTSPVLLLFAFVAILGGAFGLTVLGSYRSPDRAVYRTAWGASAIGAIVVVLALLKSGRPDPDTYMDWLWPDGTFEQGDTWLVGGRGIRLRYERAPVIVEDAAYIECRLAGLSGARPVTSFLELADRRNTERCPAIRVLVDRRGDLAFVTQVDRPLWMFDPTIAFRVSDGVALRVSAPVLADRIAAPVAWRIGGGVSVGLGLVLLGLARRFRRRAASLSGRDAYHRGEGWVSFDDEPAVLVPVAASLRRGAIALFGEEERPATYRDAPGRRFRGAAAGSIGGQRTALLDFAANLSAIAFAVVVLGVTPLVVARFYWI